MGRAVCSRRKLDRADRYLELLAVSGQNGREIGVGGANRSNNAGDLEHTAGGKFHQVPSRGAGYDASPVLALVFFVGAWLGNGQGG